MSKYPKPLEDLIGHLRKLPGIGSKSAAKLAFEIAQWEDSKRADLGTTLLLLSEKLARCPKCASYIERDAKCLFCDPNLRDLTKLCIVASPRDAIAIEETRIFQGGYFITDGLLSPLDGYGPERLSLNRLFDQVKTGPVTEAILALDATVEGEATALYLKEVLEKIGVKTTRLAFGVPLGSTLEYVDATTLQLALRSRHPF